MGYKDLTNQVFGSLTAKEIVGIHPKYRDKLWLCQCACGKTSIVRSVALSSGSIKSCGCSKAYKDVTGQRWGRLVALEKVTTTTKNYWKVKCDCGKEKVVAYHSLIKGDTKSCGCLRSEVSKSQCGEKHYAWKGGGDLKSLKQRSSSLYKNWRKQVLDFYNHRCIKCKAETNLVAHHIFSFHDNPDKRLQLSNGLCFCRECHADFHRKHGKTNNNYTQLLNFLHGSVFSFNI